MPGKVNIEVTDTFAGEANYSWAERHVLEFDDRPSDLAVMRRVKRLIGWNGVRCNVVDFGDTIEIRPRNACLVCFVT